ncbi:hypothetical protein QAD02_002017 [Eretmocerus hayati]|uniref:Uncharacterized protein n=1 Tax=Eretmocerus hayati TaxID=131215 RepID=A0ACC2NIX3_9HYME|nr:hypothetical protein QAD02_002017 [Eretmocerus hayati]
MTLEGSSHPKRLEEIRRQIEEASREEIEAIPATDALIRERIRDYRRLALIGALEFHRDNLQYAISPSPLEIEAAESNKLSRTSGVHNLDTYGVDSEEEFGPLSPALSNASLEPTASAIQQAPLTPLSEPETTTNRAGATSEAATQADATQTTATATEPTKLTSTTDVSTAATSTE